MWSRTFGKTDVESGSASEPLYPTMVESPDLRWSFIRKIYSIVSMQLLLTIVVGGFVVSNRPIITFLTCTTGGLVCFLLIILTPFITMIPLALYHNRHPVNYLLLGIFTITLAFTVGLSCAFTSGKVVLEAVILTAVVVVSLTIFTFWVTKRGSDVTFLALFFFSALMVLIIFTLIQIFFPMGKLSVMIYAGLSAIIFCGYIIYDTDNLIKRYSYDEYIWAAVALYLDIINLFIRLLMILRVTKK